VYLSHLGTSGLSGGKSTFNNTFEFRFSERVHFIVGFVEAPPVVKSPSLVDYARCRLYRIILFHREHLPYGHFTTGGIDDRIDSTLPPVFSPNTVPRSYSRLNST